MNYTEKYKFKKPEATDSYNVDDFNENTDAFEAALATKAPSGFGYGDTLTFYENTNNTFDDMLSQIWADMEIRSAKQIQIYDKEGLVDNKFIGTLWKYTDEYGVLDAVSYTGCSARKCFRNGVWGPWEWDNPPMAFNTEYRTTERYDNKPVYCKLIKFGAFPNAGTKTVEHGIDNISMITDWNSLNINSGTNIEAAGTVKSITVTKTQIIVVTEEDGSSWNVRFLLRYTKTTD